MVGKMLADLRHRGPEGAHLFVRQDVALGHAHLAFTDLEPAAVQPMVSRSSRTALSFNGEIFNYTALADTAGPMRTRSDAEVLLECLEREGMRLLPELNGFFAFAFVDWEAGKLFLVRDRFGVKPLYYVSRGGTFGFASEIRPLKRLLSFEPEAETLSHQLVSNWTQGERTGVADVLRVLPGCCLEYCLRTRTLTKRRWFSLADLRDDARRRAFERGTYAAAVAETKTVLQESIRRRASSQAPLAVLCSGGLDSGLVAAILNERQPEVEIFSVHYPEYPAWSEFGWSEAVGRHLGRKIQPVEITAERWRRLFVPTAVHFEYPLWHESSVAITAIAQDLNHRGIKGVLGGEGADELFGGYDYKYLDRRGEFFTSLGLPPGGSTADPQEKVHDVILTDLYGDFFAHGEDTRYRREVALMAEQAALSNAAAERGLETILTTELHLFLLIVLGRLDRSLMHFSIEGREPYLDQELVSLAFNLPLRWKTYPRTKEILREIGRAYLPDKILDRKKRGFSIDPELFLRGHMNPRFLHEANLRDYLRKNRSAWKKAVDRLAGRSTMRVAGAEIWFRTMFLHEPPEQIEEDFWMRV